MADQRTTAGGLLGLHAQTPVHPGSGTALGAVDQPVQRERHTHWPNAAGSSLKGILRDACREAIGLLADVATLPRHDDFDEKGELKPEEVRAKARKEARGKKELADHTLRLNELFGPPTTGASEFAGALSVTDARLLAFPVRSLKGVFAWVTCPAFLDRFRRDAELAGVPLPGWPDAVPSPGRFECAAAADCPCVGLSPPAAVLEEFEFKKAAGDPAPVAKAVAAAVLPAANAYQGTRVRFEKALVVLSDDDFTYFARYATEVLARIRLNYETKTVDGGALFYQEFLPAETLLYAVVLANPTRGRSGKTAAGLLADFAGFVSAIPVLQVGGDESVGKGYCGVRLATANGGAA